MLAIYKRELKSYFTTMIGFVFMAFFLAIMGIYTVMYNLVNAYSNFEYVLSSLAFVLIFLVPILTMRVIAEEKKQKTDQLLYTSPVSIEKIVIGKYLAVLTLFFIAMAITLLYPIILSQFGSVNFYIAYSAIFGFALMGAAYISIGVLISAITESQLIAAVVSFLVFLLTGFMPSIAQVLPSDNITCFMIVLALVVLASWLLYFLIHSIKLSIVTAGIGGAFFTGIYLIKPSFFDGLLSKLCNSISVMSRFNNFILGILDGPAICYFVSVIIVSLFMTIVLIKKDFTSRKLKHGVYRSLLIAVVTAIVVVLNLMVSKINPTADLSDNAMYTLTKETKEFVKDIKDSITIYYVVQDGMETSEFELIVNEYKGLSDKVKVVKKDPVLYPNFTSSYTDEEVENESIIVVNNSTDISKYIAYSDMMKSEMDYSSYQSYVSEIDIEGQITAAMQYVTKDELPKMYEVSGHGEALIGDSLKASIAKLNIQLEEIETLTVGEIPKDCSILLINAPTSDLTEEETAMIKSYLEDGGKAILNTAYTDNSMEYYDGLLAYYGVSRVEGIVLEEAGNYVNNYPSCIIPQKISHEITDSIDNYMMLAVAQGLSIAEDIRSSVTVDSLLTTTDHAYSKVNVDSDTIAKEEKDISGPFVLGAAITENFEEKETKIVTVSCGFLLDDEILGGGQYGNETFFLHAISWLEGEDITSSIPSKPLTQVYLTVSPSQAVFWGVVFVILIPLLHLAAGFIIWLKRRKNV